MAVHSTDSSSGAPVAGHYTLKQGRYSSHSKIVELAGEGHGRTCVDAGCASGYLARELSRNGWRMIGIESDAEAAQEARRHCVDVVEADLTAFDFGGLGPYDAIVFGDVLEHLPEPSRTLRDATAHLSSGGVTVVSVPNVAHLVVRLSLLAGRFEYADRGILDRTHLRFFTRESLLRFLRECGLEVEVLTCTPAPIEEVFSRVRHRRLRWITSIANASSLAWPTLLAYQFLAKARPFERRSVQRS